MYLAAQHSGHVFLAVVVIVLVFTTLFNMYLNVLCLVSMALWRQERVIAVKVYYINPL